MKIHKIFYYTKTRKGGHEREKTPYQIGVNEIVKKLEEPKAQKITNSKEILVFDNID